MVLCPRCPLYFDFVQDESHEVCRRWGGFNPIADVYAFPDSLEIDERALPQIRDFLTWPRLIAVAEAAWTQKER